MQSILIVLTLKELDLKVQYQEYQTQLLQVRALELEAEKYLQVHQLWLQTEVSSEAAKLRGVYLFCQY